MAQIIDMEERRKPRPAGRGTADPPPEFMVLDPMAWSISWSCP